ncbi:MAG: GtrA family protein [Anaerolineae bacterium]|nr:GtrA family protein [Anaerolineae bacterium]
MVAMFANAAGRMGVNTKEAERFIKFLVVGAFGFIVDFGIYNLLLGPFTAFAIPGTPVDEFLLSLGLSQAWIEATLPALLAGTVSFVCAICSNFTWNRYWTYPDSRSKPLVRQFAQFFLVSVTGIVLRLPIMALTHLPFTRLAAELFGSLGPDVAQRIGDNMALALSVLVILFWNFFINRYWTYGDVDK